MSRYIEFTASQYNYHTKFSLGQPVHNGEVPTRFRQVRGVRVDGEHVEFVDDSIVESLHKTIVNNKRASRRRRFNCYAFVAAMHDVDLTEKSTSRLSSGLDVDPEDASIAAPVLIGNRAGYVGSTTVAYSHALSPAPTVEGSRYLHKLGFSGPLCLSGLRVAMDMYSSSVAHLFQVQAEQTAEQIT